MRRGSLHAPAREADAQRRGLRLEPQRKRRLRRVRHKAERHDHRRISRLRGHGGTCRSWKHQRIEALALHDGVDAVGAGHPHVRRAIGTIAVAIALEIDFV